MHPKDAYSIANSEDPDQTDLGLHLFAQTSLSENLGSLRYISLGAIENLLSCQLVTICS